MGKQKINKYIYNVKGAFSTTLQHSSKTKKMKSLLKTNQTKNTGDDWTAFIYLSGSKSKNLKRHGGEYTHKRKKNQRSQNEYIEWRKG